MALLVSDNGELQSLRYLVNSNHNIPRNLILKLFTSNTTPAESDVPTQLSYYEPYDASGTIGYGLAPSTGYPQIVNNRTDQDYSNQYGILLNGSEWNVRTILNPIATTNASGSVGEYLITVTSTLNIAVGHYVEGGGVGQNATVAAIDGNTIVLTQPNVSTFSEQALEFGRGTTTASYPEQTFTFTSAANQCYGYYLVRANNLPVDIHGVEDATSVSVGSTVAKSQTIGTIGQKFITLFQFTNTPSAVGGESEFSIDVDNSVGITTGQIVVGSGIAPETRVIGISTNTVYLDKANVGAVTGIATFFVNVTENITIGMGVTHGFLPGEVNAIQENTVITGINERDNVIYLSNELVNNIQSATGNTVFFNYSEITATDHGLIPGDVIYVAAGTGNTTTTSSTYTVFETTDKDTFTTTPALKGEGDSTLYSSIFFAERFTNGPYNIQNDGDQIKVTLNVSLD